MNRRNNPTNFILKISQSFFGLIGISLQSRILDSEKLTVYLIIVGLILISSQLDFGFGMNLTTTAVHKSSKSRNSGLYSVNEIFASNLPRLFLLGFIQTIITITIFVFLIKGRQLDPNLAIFMIFAFTLMIQTTGSNVGRIFLSLGKISMLIRLQFAGALLQLLFMAIFLTSSLNLYTAIFSNGISSLLISVIAIFKFHLLKNMDRNSVQNVFSFDGWIIQFEQVNSIFTPLLVQYQLLRRFDTGLIAQYLVLQRIFQAIANAQISEFQSELSKALTRKSKVALFKERLFEFEILTLMLILVSTVLSYLWNLLFPSARALSKTLVASFILMTLIYLVEQLLKYNLLAKRRFIGLFATSSITLLILIYLLATVTIANAIFFNYILAFCIFIRSILLFGIFVLKR